MRARNNKIDILRIIAAFSVIFIHCESFVLHSPAAALARFAVPVFFMISGYFFFDRINPSKFKKRIKHYCIILLCSFAVYSLLFMTTDLLNITNIYKSIADNFSVNTIINLVVFNDPPFAEYLWFLLALIYCEITAYISAKFGFTKILYFLIVPLILADIVFGKYSPLLFNLNIDAVFFRNWIFCGLPYFFLGALIKNQQDKDALKISKAALYFSIVLFSFTLLFENYLCMNNPISNERGMFLSCPFLTISIFLWAVAPISDRANNSYPVKTLASMGRKYSLYIYLFHLIIIFFFSAILIKFPQFKTLYSFISPFLVFIIMLLISMIYVKIKNAVISKYINQK